VAQELTPAQVYAQARAVGFTPDAARTLTAIGEATSKLDPSWLGPSSGVDGLGQTYGLFGITTVKAATGTGDVRDVAALAASPTNQAQAAYELSHGGDDFTAWPAYTSGAYTAYLDEAQAASVAAPTDPNPLPTWGPAWAPWNWPSDAGNAASGIWDAIVSDLRNVAIEIAFVGLGLALLAAGIGQTVKSRKTNG